MDRFAAVTLRPFVLTVLLTTALAAPAGAASRDPWSDLAVEDLQAIHTGLLENHPGPVDPQNPRYRAWLEDGLRAALKKAANARSYSDYIRALGLYTNGFQDGHVAVYADLRPNEMSWPGFVVGGDTVETAHVIFAEKDSGVAIGARLVSCDGRTTDRMMADRVDPFFWNSAIPQERHTQLSRLFYQDAGDPQPRWKSCRFSTGTVVLSWRNDRATTFAQTLDVARGTGLVAPRLVRVGACRSSRFQHSSSAATRKSPASRNSSQR
jgi:hypothetical protein